METTESQPNTIKHKLGAHVLHEADNPVPEMTMQVVKIKADGETYVTQYIHPDNGDRDEYENHFSRLYLPEEHPDVVNPVCPSYEF